MLKYQPPKSNCYGHWLGKQSPETTRSRLAQFLNESVLEYHFQEAGLSITGANLQNPLFEPTDLISRFENLLGVKAPEGFRRLSEVQFEQCFKELVAYRETIVRPGTHFILTQSFNVTKWFLKGTVVPTNSDLMIFYGSKPLMIPGLRFNNRDEFALISDGFERSRLCKLNEKHVRKVTRGR